MNVNRVNRWKAELGLRVEREVGSDEFKKTLWLIEHLSEYLQRWVGFARMKEVGVGGTFDTDAFCILVGASQVIKEMTEMKGDDRFPNEEWMRFENALDYIQEYPFENNLDIVTESFSCLQSALSSW